MVVSNPNLKLKSSVLVVVGIVRGGVSAETILIIGVAAGVVMVVIIVVEYVVVVKVWIVDVLRVVPSLE
eukprot:CAMPEP_0198265832 /NCGR_PEP_ID=MMETSP1447-20131203/24922_1 /TAXON_ID=420782 /ORGANISM="Chaetoceros dichaeta, Strain CCMP1751" /LENGTH=68 /DNA_ID=CAMNT_0043955547 /DNA_START=66 /DNA_END=272 /DNA_ORIENTATION=+